MVTLRNEGRTGIMALRRLTVEEVAKLASRKGVRKIAVENFLMSVTANPDASSAFANLDMDARSYKWNAATRNAISAGIALASR